MAGGKAASSLRHKVGRTDHWFSRLSGLVWTSHSQKAPKVLGEESAIFGGTDHSLSGRAEQRVI